MHELKCINYSSTDSEQLFSRSTSSSSHQRRSTDTRVLEGLPSSLLVLLDSVVTFFPEGEATLISVGIRAHRTWYCQRERSVHPLCMSGRSIIISGRASRLGTEFATGSAPVTRSNFPTRPGQQILGASPAPTGGVGQVESGSTGGARPQKTTHTSQICTASKIHPPTFSNDLRTFFFAKYRYQIRFPNICEFRGPKIRGTCTGAGRMRRFGSAPS